MGAASTAAVTSQLTLAKNKHLGQRSNTAAAAVPRFGPLSPGLVPPLTPQTRRCQHSYRYDITDNSINRDRKEGSQCSFGCYSASHQRLPLTASFCFDPLRIKTEESAVSPRHTSRVQVPCHRPRKLCSPVGRTEAPGFLVNMAAAPLLWTLTGRTPPLPPSAAPPLPPHNHAHIR